MAARAVCFDVDFTLIYPGPTFGARGYGMAGARHGLSLDERGFDAAVAAAAPLLRLIATTGRWRGFIEGLREESSREIRTTRNA